jgi:hypothetical protein
MAQRTGLEPATPGVTGRYSNQLNYRCIYTMSLLWQTIHQELKVAQRTGLEPATPGVTGRYSNQLNYRCIISILTLKEAWWALTGSNRRHSACKADALPTELSALSNRLHRLMRCIIENPDGVSNAFRREFMFLCSSD